MGSDGAGLLAAQGSGQRLWRTHGLKGRMPGLSLYLAAPEGIAKHLCNKLSPRGDVASCH